MLDPQKISLFRVKQAYSLNEHEAQNLLHELSPERVFPYEIWHKAYVSYWKSPAAESSRLYEVENPPFPETRSQPIKHCPTDVYAEWMMNFFFEMARRISAAELEKGFDYIIESTYDNKFSVSETDREYLFRHIVMSDKNIANAARVKGVKDIDLRLSAPDVILKIFPDTIAVDKISAIHYLSVVQKYPFDHEVKGITRSLVESVIKAATQESPHIPEPQPGQETSVAEVQPPEQGSVIRVPASLFEGKPDTAVRDAMKDDYHRSVIAYVLLNWCEVDKTRTGRLLTEEQYSDPKSYRNLVDRLLEKTATFTIIKV